MDSPHQRSARNARPPFVAVPRVRVPPGAASIAARAAYRALGEKEADKEGYRLESGRVSFIEYAMTAIRADLE